MKRHSYRKSSVGIINPVFQGKEGSSFFRHQAEKNEAFIPSAENDHFFDPMLQREADDKGEESVQSAADEEESVKAKGEEEEAVQSAVEEEESVQAQDEEEEAVQSAAEEEESVQAKTEEEEAVQAATEEEEAVQAATEEEESVQAKEESGGKDSHRQRQANGIESTLFQEKGKGRPIEAGTRGLMEKKFGADFSRVRIHTGQKAQLMNKKIQAKAFTHGFDIFFNQGQYQPETSEGKHLLAHELTHTIQQKGIPKKQVQPQSNDGKPGFPDSHKAGKSGLKSQFSGVFTKNKD